MRPLSRIIVAFFVLAAIGLLDAVNATDSPPIRRDTKSRRALNQGLLEPPRRGLDLFGG